MTTTNTSNRVRFHASVHVVEVLNLQDYKPSEIAAAWYSTEQMEKITNRCFKVLKSINAGKGQKYCTRGLEGHTHLGSISKKRSRSAATAAVINEQTRQWIEDIADEQAIADVYRRTTSSCQLWAQVMGNQDRKAADAVLYKEEKEEFSIDEVQPACSQPKKCTHSSASSRSTSQRIMISRELVQPSRSRNKSPQSSRLAARLVAVA